MEWCDRALIMSPYYYGLCKSPKLFKKELRRLKVPKEQWPSFLGNKSANATLHFFETGSGEKAAICCLGSMKGKTKEQVFSLLLHEAVHLWQIIKVCLGEKEPSPEFEAYAIQTIAQRLMEAL